MSRLMGSEPTYEDGLAEQQKKIDVLEKRFMQLLRLCLKSGVFEIRFESKDGCSEVIDLKGVKW